MGADKTKVVGVEVTSLTPAARTVPEPEISVFDRENPSLLDLDKSTLDPNFEYRFVYKSNTRIARTKAKGYVKVDPDQEEITNTVGDKLEVDADGFYAVGDTVLMKCRREKFEARKERDVDLTNSRLKAAKRKFKREARAAGTTTKLGKED